MLCIIIEQNCCGTQQGWRVASFHERIKRTLPFGFSLSQIRRTGCDFRWIFQKFAVPSISHFHHLTQAILRICNGAYNWYTVLYQRFLNPFMQTLYQKHRCLVTLCHFFQHRGIKELGQHLTGILCTLMPCLQLGRAALHSFGMSCSSAL